MAVCTVTSGGRLNGISYRMSFVCRGSSYKTGCLGRDKSFVVRVVRKSSKTSRSSHEKSFGVRVENKAQCNESR
jgi:hypothetical protein